MQVQIVQINFKCKWFATTLTSTQVAVLPWRGDVELGTANSLYASA